MKNRLSAVLTAGLIFGAAMAATTTAHAQAWSEANTPGFVGGYGHFGGYYDTFGIYGGRSTYLGYQRTEGGSAQTVTLLTVPLGKRAHGKAVRVKIVHAHDDCGWLRHRARDTGARKWQRRYDACRRQA